MICGLREKSKVDPSTAREDYYASGTTHGMMVKIMPDGDLEPMSLWFGAEEIACQRVISLTKQHRKPKWVPDDEERVSNSILAMKGRDILTFYNRNFPLSKLVHANHEFINDGTPDVTWQIQKLLIFEAEALMRRDQTALRASMDLPIGTNILLLLLLQLQTNSVQTSRPTNRRLRKGRASAGHLRAQENAGLEIPADLDTLPRRCKIQKKNK